MFIFRNVNDQNFRKGTKIYFKTNEIVYLTKTMHETWRPCQMTEGGIGSKFLFYTFNNTRTTRAHTRSMAVVLALHGCGGEPRRVGAIIIHHMISPHPHQLVALVEVELRHGGPVPPIPPLGTAAAPLHVIRSRYHLGALARVDLEPFVRGYKGCMRPICLHPAPLSCPIISIPNWAVNSHCLILWEWDSFVL